MGREDSCHLILLGFYESSAHPEPRYFASVEGQVTFSGIGGQPGPAQLHEHPPQPLQVVFPGLRMNDDVIQVGRGVGLVGPQQDVHQSLKVAEPVQAEGKKPDIASAHWGWRKRVFGFASSDRAPANSPS